MCNILFQANMKYSTNEITATIRFIVPASVLWSQPGTFFMNRVRSHYNEIDIVFVLLESGSNGLQSCD